MRHGRTAIPAARTSPETEARLEVQGLTVALRGSGTEVVSDVSLSVPAGQVLGLVGESGSGKTTVALALLGHARRGLQITAGQVRIDGTDLLALSQAGLRAIRGATVSYVAQDPSSALNPALRIGTQLREVLAAHPAAADDPGARMAEVLHEVSLEGGPEILRRYPHQLSGGQQQRVCLAMAFACRPSLIVLDEPTTGLDVTTQRHVLETVRSLCASHGVAAVYVSHDLAVVSGLAAQVAVMYAGRIVEIGPATRLFQEPMHPYTRRLIAAVPSPDHAYKLAGIDGQQPRPGQRQNACSFVRRCSLAVSECSAATPGLTEVNGRLVRCIRATDAKPGQVPRPPLLQPALGRPEPPLLAVRRLSAAYGPAHVLHEVAFEVPPESCVAVVGESGSGKTTLARCICGLHRSWTGEIALRALPLPSGTRHRSKELLRTVQYIFQNPYTSLNPRKTIGQIMTGQLGLFWDLRSRDRSERVVRVLEDVSLSADYLNRYPDELSGGERQRVAIARALVVEPDLLVCDEVTSALDVSVQATIVELLRRLQAERHLTLIFVTHNLALIRSIAQFAVVLRGGHVVESGPVAQILDHPSDLYTARLAGDVPRLISGRPGDSQAGERPVGDTPRTDTPQNGLPHCGKQISPADLDPRADARGMGA